jgi:hypothetical protein
MIADVPGSTTAAAAAAAAVLSCCACSTALLHLRLQSPSPAPGAAAANVGDNPAQSQQSQCQSRTEIYRLSPADRAAADELLQQQPELRAKILRITHGFPQSFLYGDERRGTTEGDIFHFRVGPNRATWPA